MTQELMTWLAAHPGSTAEQAAAALGESTRIVGSLLSVAHKAGKLTAQSIWIATARPTITRAVLHYSLGDQSVALTKERDALDAICELRYCNSTDIAITKTNAGILALGNVGVK